MKRSTILDIFLSNLNDNPLVNLKLNELNQNLFSSNRKQKS